MEIPSSLSNAIKTKVEDGRLSVSAKILEEKDALLIVTINKKSP